MPTFPNRTLFCESPYTGLDKEGTWHQERKKRFYPEFYLSKLNAHIRTPVHRLRNLEIAHKALGDFLYDRTSSEVLAEVLGRVKELDRKAERRGVADPFTMVAPSTDSTEERAKNAEVISARIIH
jgi:hypothetical protein